MKADVAGIELLVTVIAGFSANRNDSLKSFVIGLPPREPRGGVVAHSFKESRLIELVKG